MKKLELGKLLGMEPLTEEEMVREVARDEVMHPVYPYMGTIMAAPYIGTYNVIYTSGTDTTGTYMATITPAIYNTTNAIPVTYNIPLTSNIPCYLSNITTIMY